MYCSTVRLEKPTGPQTVKKLPALYINRIFITHSQQPSVMSQFISCLLIPFNIILPSTPTSFKWSLSLKCPHQTPHDPLSSVRAIGPTYIVIFYLLTPLIQCSVSFNQSWEIVLVVEKELTLLLQVLGAVVRTSRGHYSRAVFHQSSHTTAEGPYGFQLGEWLYMFQLMWQVK